MASGAGAFLLGWAVGWFSRGWVGSLEDDK